MARMPHPPNATRFFARVISAVLECPKCGTVAALGRGISGLTPTQGWDPTTARWKCHGCSKTYLIGLIAWPVRMGGWTTGTKPMDQVPNERQLAQMRGEAGGYWMEEEYAQPRHKPEHTNVTARCTCPQDDRGEITVSAECAIHGKYYQGEP